MKNYNITNFYEFKNTVLVKIRDFPKFLKFVKFAFSIYGCNIDGDGDNGYDDDDDNDDYDDDDDEWGWRWRWR